MLKFPNCLVSSGILLTFVVSNERQGKGETLKYILQHVYIGNS